MIAWLLYIATATGCGRRACAAVTWAPRSLRRCVQARKTQRQGPQPCKVLYAPCNDRPNAQGKASIRGARRRGAAYAASANTASESFITYQLARLYCAVWTINRHGGGVTVVAFATEHRVVSQGYIIRHRRSLGLKPEYKGLEGAELGRLREAGVELSVMRNSIEVAYTGDTNMSGIAHHTELWQAKLIIIECMCSVRTASSLRYTSACSKLQCALSWATYLDGTTEHARKWQHVHIDDIVQCAAQFSAAAEVVLCHVSSRYSQHQVLELLRAALPPELLIKTSVTLTEFGSQQVLKHCCNSCSSSASSSATSTSGGSISGSSRNTDGIDTATAAAVTTAAAAAASSSIDPLNLC
eukprot:12036-Heterococcus_DN1.PRE.2